MPKTATSISPNNGNQSHRRRHQDVRNLIAAPPVAKMAVVRAGIIWLVEATVLLDER
jgi:hypothetical protein